MNTLRYNNPWNLLGALQRDFHPQFHKTDNTDTADTSANWTPSVDVTEEENAYVLHADIPGVNPAEIEISTDKGVLSIQGERASIKRDSEDSIKRVERYYGKFNRRFTLPDNANIDLIEAKSEHGVLSITIPKKEDPASRKIEVKLQ